VLTLLFSSKAHLSSLDDYNSCLHSPLWCNPFLFLISYKMTYLVWWLVGFYWDADRHVLFNLFFSTNTILILPISYIRTNERYERVIVMYVVFFFFFVIHIMKMSRFAPVRRRWTNAPVLIFFLLFLGHSLFNMLQWIVTSKNF
jgi:hypothetical protein